jgi:hypothetical protein
VMALAAVVSGCISEAAGSQVWGVNESDRDVIVTSALHGESFVLPAHVFGKLFDAYRAPDHDLLVFDTDCRLLATLPLRVPLETVHISPTGEPGLTGHDPGIVPPTVRRAPTGQGDGDAFEARSCP